MFIKEIFSVITFSFVTLIFSGFAIKVDKFEYSALTSTSKQGEREKKDLYWLDMPEESKEKLNLKIDQYFHYFEDGKEKSAKIIDFQPKKEIERPKKIKYIRVILDVNNQERNITNMKSNVFIFSTSQPSNTTEKQEKKETTKVIKYFVETKSFWANLFC